MENRCHTTTEVVNGIIIDGDAPQYAVRGMLFSFKTKRPQSGYFQGNCDHDIRLAALAYITSLKAEIGEAEYKTLYPNGMELRIWDN